MGVTFRGKALKTYNGRELLNENRISELPDDILVNVLSYLTLKETGRMSVLSKRWRHVWSYVPTLNFDSCNISHEISIAKKTLEVEMPRYKLLEPEKHTYVRWVDQVVSSHNTPAIDEFRVQCLLREHSEQSIDNWVRFAMEKRVKRFGMDFSPTHGAQRSHYTFPSSSFCNSLTSLELSGVNVTGEALEIFLHNCRFLEFLSVSDSESLLNLKVVGSSLNLKYLIICYCYEMEHLEISAPNIVYFSYYGPSISVPFKSTPKLAEISIGGDYGKELTNNIMEHSSYLFQLEALRLNVYCSMESIMQSVQFPELTRLKKLDVIVDPWPSESLFCLKSLIKACPFLHKFALQVDLDTRDYNRKPSRKKRVFPHYHLKIVEFVGFDGHAICLEFAIWLLDIAVSLERIIVDPRQPSEIGGPRAFHSCERKRAKAKQLGTYLKPGTDLIIL